jgi:hypothetical protein
LEFRLDKTDETGERVPSRSIRTTGRMTTVAAPAGTGGGFWRGARRACENTTTVPMASPGRQANRNRDIDISMAEAIPRTICARHG